MKKALTLITFLFLFTQISFAQGQKTFVKSLTLESASIFVDINATATITEWDKNFVRITATIDVPNFSEEILNRLFMVGRYDIVSTVENGKMIITMPKLAKPVTIRGELLIEGVSYEIAVPEGTIVNVKEQIINHDALGI